MGRKIFFSFNYDRDAWRAGQVRNCDLIPNEDEYGFVDAVAWESIKRQGEDAIRRWIDNQMEGTSVTVVLIGAETAERPWVQYEIERSWNRGNGLVGVQIHNLKNQDSTTDASGHNPFDDFKLSNGTLLSSVCRTYDWTYDDGRNNLGKWAEEAFQLRSRYGNEDQIRRAGMEMARAARAASVSSSFTPRAPWCPDDVDRDR